ncbi:hypothetical protein RRG08_000085 [Elysia crispata]|uniref:Uncharacterized protein n=1 Tax=Elysia crispata TaxID=231223 RepID=A0AAE1A1R7_9GAST|nr:hypothetical protein RRG08_000085 [Elysia crispata]
MISTRVSAGVRVQRFFCSDLSAVPRCFSYAPPCPKLHRFQAPRARKFCYPGVCFPGSERLSLEENMGEVTNA